MKTLLRKITVLQRHRTTFRGGGTPHRKMNTGIGDIAQTFLMRGTNGWGKIYPAHTLLRGGQLGWGHRTTLKDQTPSRHNHTDTHEKLHSLLQSKKMLNKSSYTPGGLVVGWVPLT